MELRVHSFGTVARPRPPCAESAGGGGRGSGRGSDRGDRGRVGEHPSKTLIVGSITVCFFTSRSRGHCVSGSPCRSAPVASAGRRYRPRRACGSRLRDRGCLRRSPPRTIDPHDAERRISRDVVAQDHVVPKRHVCRSARARRVGRRGRALPRGERGAGWMRRRRAKSGEGRERLSNHVRMSRPLYTLRARRRAGDAAYATKWPCSILEHFLLVSCGARLAEGTPGRLETRGFEGGARPRATV